jgi:hypothetical protein
MAPKGAGQQTCVARADLPPVTVRNDICDGAPCTVSAEWGINIYIAVGRGGKTRASSRAARR